MARERRSLSTLVLLPSISPAREEVLVPLCWSYAISRRRPGVFSVFIRSQGAEIEEAAAYGGAANGFGDGEGDESARAGSAARDWGGVWRCAEPQIGGVREISPL